MTEKVLIEINRLKNELDGYSAREALDYIESYINTLSKQQVEESHKIIDLEEAVEVEGVAVWQYLDKNGRDFYKVETEEFTTHGDICEGDKVRVIILKKED